VNLDLRQYWITLRDVMRFAGRRAYEERIAQVAGSLTFTTILSLVPLFTVAFATLTALPLFAQIEASLRDVLVRNLMPPNVSDSIFRYLDQFASKARGLTLIGLVFLTVTAVSTMLTVDRALNRIWHVRRPRPLAQRVLVYWAVLTIGPIVLALSLTVTSYLVSASNGLAFGPTPFMRVIIDVVPVAVLALAYAALYVYVPNRGVSWRDALVGGACGAVAFDVAKRGFALYLSRFPSYTIIYGTLAALPIFLLWIYVSWLVTLFGATVAAILPSLYERVWNRGQAPGQNFGDALRILRALDRARDGWIGGMTTAQIQGASRLGWDEALPLLERLEADGIVARTRRIVASGATRAGPDDLWMIGVDPAKIPMRRIFTSFAFDGPAVAGIGFDAEDPLAEAIRAMRLDDGGMMLADALATPTP